MTKKEMQMHALKIRRIFKNADPKVDGTTFEATLQSVKEELVDVCQIIQGTPEEALIILTHLATNSQYGLALFDIDEFLNMEKDTSCLFLSEAIRSLMDKLLIEEGTFSRDKTYILTSLTRKMVDNELCYDDIKPEVAKERRTLRHLCDELFISIWDNNNNEVDALSDRIFACLSKHKHWIFVNKLLDVRNKYDSFDWAFFVWLMTKQTYTGSASVEIDAFINRFDVGNMRNYQILSSTKLGKEGYISSYDELWSNRIKITITQRAWMDFLSDEFPFMRLIVEGPALKEVKKNNIAPRRLFYNSNLQEELNALLKIMKLGKFEEFSKKQSKNGYKGRLTILFDGPPGTGKTEFVHQLAVKAGRLLMMVDIAEIRSKWVGESEKNIAAIFDDYSRAKENYGYAPIMLLDEADAIISRRFGVNNSVDQMSNTMQNLLLQHIERMAGILIATTNLRDNMDSAFERRFLMKLKFTYPDNETRMRILKDKLGLDKSDAEAIASSYVFTGADIENVVQKLSMMKFLGKRINNDVIIQQLHQDLHSASGRNSIGFKL